MELYAQVLSYAIPGFALLMLIESIAARMMGMQVNYGMDTISSISSGLTNTLKSILGLTLIIVSYGWMVDHFALFEIESTVWLYVIAFIGIDFASYWSHRWNHTVNLFWNRHIVHHSSEEFNLACALRQTISTFVSIYFFLYIPLAIIGVPAEVIAITAPIHLFAQFWYHTRLVNKMGILEHIIVTPSHHRVHHGINPEYLDKNYAAIFIVWDKWFGTFQEELPDVPAVYGTKRPAHTWNPILINFMHVWLLIKDAWYTQSWWDKVRLFFMPTGWRPADVAARFPVESTPDVYQQKKYRPPASKLLLYWSWAQLLIHNVLLYYILVKIVAFPFTDVLLYSGFLMVSIFAYTTLMDRHWLAVPIEVLKCLMGAVLIYVMGGWFLLDEVLPGGTLIMIAYLAISLGITVYNDRMREGGKERME